MPQMPIDLDGLQQMARIAALFGQPQQPSTAEDPTDVMNNDIWSRMSQIYQPRTNISSQYQQSLQQMPQRDEHPGKLRRLGAALSSLSTVGPAGYDGGNPVGFRDYNPELGDRIGDEFLNKSYYDKLSDWKLRTDTLNKGAVEEDRYNTNQRILASDVASRQLGVDRLEQQRIRDENTKNDKAVMRDLQGQRVANQRASVAIARYKAEHPNRIIKIVGSDLVAVDPSPNGKSEVLKDEDGNPFDSGKLDDTTKMAIDLHNKLAEIAARTAGSVTVEGAKQTNREANIDTREKNLRGRPVKANTPMTTTSTSTISPDQKSKTTVTTRTPQASATADSDLRQRAIKMLTDAKKPITEANVKYVMSQLGAAK